MNRREFFKRTPVAVAAAALVPELTVRTEPFPFERYGTIERTTSGTFPMWEEAKFTRHWDEFWGLHVWKYDGPDDAEIREQCWVRLHDWLAHNEVQGRDIRIPVLSQPSSFLSL